MFEELFKAEDENELELHNSLKAMKQAKENKNTAEVQQLKAKVKQLQFQKAKIKEEIKDATEKNSIYYRAAKPYLDAKRTLIQVSNYSHFDDIKLLYAYAKARLDVLETEQLAVK